MVSECEQIKVEMCARVRYKCRKVQEPSIQLIWPCILALLLARVVT